MYRGIIVESETIYIRHGLFARKYNHGDRDVVEMIDSNCNLIDYNRSGYVWRIISNNNFNFKHTDSCLMIHTLTKNGDVLIFRIYNDLLYQSIELHQQDCLNYDFIIEPNRLIKAPKLHAAILSKKEEYIYAYTQLAHILVRDIVGIVMRELFTLIYADRSSYKIITPD